MGSGDPMFERNVRLAALGASALGALVLSGCGASNGVDTAPPATRDQPSASTTPDLMGAPPPPNAAAAPDGLLGGAPGTAPAPVAVAPIADASSAPPKKASMLKTWRRPDGTLVTAMRPIPNPKAARVVHHLSHVASASAPKVVAKPVPAKPVVAAAPAPKVVAAAPPALKPVAQPKPVEALAKAPTPAIPAPVAPAAAKPLSKIDKLQAAIAPEATKGAVLAAGESLGKGEAGQVTLSLPATLGDLIKAQAAKLGLTKAAKKTSAYAKLEGEGYEVTPNGKQTAVVKPGEPTTFAWQVKPGADAKGQLKSEFGLELNGAKTAQTFSLGEIVKRVAPVKEQVETKTNSLLTRLNLPGLDGSVNLPGLGPTPLKSVLGGALVLLAVIILAMISRSASASRAKAERQRKFRTLTDYGRNEMEPDAPTTAHVSYVNPMVAAAVGAAAATAVSHDHHDDHHAPAADHHDDHAAHDDQAHGHDEHAHDDHGHAEDLHAHAHPDPHAPAEHVGYVSPMVAATHAPAHDDGHGHADHGHAVETDHGHDAQGHDSHGHDDHGHDASGHDAHAAGDHGHDTHHAKELEHAH